MKKRIVALFLTGLMAFGALTGCSTPAPQTNTPAETKTETPAASNAEEEPIAEDLAEESTNDGTEKVLRLGITTEPPSLDQQLSTDTVSFELMNAIYEGLVRLYEGEARPGVAESWDISDDGLTYTFHLRDTNWSDGQPVTAKDFEYAFFRLLDPDTASEYAFQGYYIKGGEAYNTGTGSREDVGIKAIDDKTFEVTLEVPTTYFLALMGFGSFYPTRQDLVELHGESYATDPDKMVYNGPFELAEWAHEASLEIVKRDDYWDASAIKLQRVEFPIIADSKTVINMYEEGSLDYAGLGKDFVDQYKASGEAKYYYDGAVMYFELNQKASDPTKAQFLQNKKFRQAFGYAVDRKLYIDTVLKNNSDPSERYNFALLAGPTPGKKFNEEYPYSFYPVNADMDKAKQLLEEACTELGTTVDQIPTFEYLTDDSDDVKVQAEAIQSMIKQLGINLEIKQVPFKERLDLMTAFDYEIVGALWGPDYDDVMTFMDLWVTDGGHNSVGMSVPKYDELVLGAKKEADAKTRGDMLFEAEKILLEEAAIIPIYVRRRAYVLRDYVQNMPLNFIGATRDYVYADIVE